jgi:hypothetical protein
VQRLVRRVKHWPRAAFERTRPRRRATKRSLRIISKAARPLVKGLFPGLGLLSILALTVGTVGVPTGARFAGLWPLAAFTVVAICLVWFLYRTSRETQDAIFANVFGWLPVFLAALSYLYWHWYATQQGGTIDSEFFLASAEVLPILLLATVVDVRRTERLESRQLVLPVVAVFLGELAALNALAFGGPGPDDFAAVASSFVSSTVALVLAVMANVDPSANHAAEAVRESSGNAPERRGSGEPEQSGA